MKVKGSLYWIYSFTSGCKGKMLVAILLAVIGVLCGMAPYFALAGILSGLIQNTLTAERIVCYVGIAVLGETLKMLFNTVSSLKAHRAAYHILGNIRCKLAEKMMRVPMGIMVDTPSGKLKAMVVDTVDKLEQPLAHMLPEITANVFTPLCIIILLFILDWRMALACMIVIPIGFLLLMGQMKDYKNRSDRYIEASGNMDSSLVEYVRQEMTFPICVMFLFAAFLVYSQMDGLASNIALLRIVDTALSQVESVLEIPEMSGNDTIDKIQNYNIELHNISFGYENRPIIQNVTLKIPEHRVTAIVGPSGSGKTTLCNLITRFWDVQQGEIMIGGKNIKEIEFEELMKLMSIVFQKVYLFHDTIENNIKFGKPTVTHAEDQSSGTVSRCV